MRHDLSPDLQAAYNSYYLYKLAREPQIGIRASVLPERKKSDGPCASISHVPAISSLDLYKYPALPSPPYNIK